MTEFEFRVETTYSADSTSHECGSAELNLFFDEKSARAFFQWMADGCKGSLAISEKGCEYCPIPLSINANPTEEDIERIKKAIEDTPLQVVPSWRVYPANTTGTPYTGPYEPHMTCQQPPGEAIQTTAYPTEATGTYHLEKTEDSETKAEK